MAESAVLVSRHSAERWCAGGVFVCIADQYFEGRRKPQLFSQRPWSQCQSSSTTQLEKTVSSDREEFGYCAKTLKSSCVERWKIGFVIGNR